jgi:hypothetical protein
MLTWLLFCLQAQLAKNNMHMLIWLPVCHETGSQEKFERFAHQAVDLAACAGLTGGSVSSARSCHLR